MLILAIYKKSTTTRLPSPPHYYFDTFMAFSLSVSNTELWYIQAHHDNTGMSRHLLLEQLPVQHDAFERSDDDVLNGFYHRPKPRMPEWIKQ